VIPQRNRSVVASSSRLRSVAEDRCARASLLVFVSAREPEVRRRADRERPRRGAEGRSSERRQSDASARRSADVTESECTVASSDVCSRNVPPSLAFVPTMRRGV